jgi:phosphoribosyl 1,2-cyclic phosphodiesterase|nr:MAG TPA: Metal-dependent hydrolases of the beta-lactamase superfamily I [Caudoviricetes sp.]
MRLNVLGSDSNGNCYVLQTDKEALIIEAGVRFSEVKKALKWQLSKVVGAVITHEHNDHAKYIRDFVSNGITVLALPSVFRAKGIDSLSFRKEIEPMHGYIVGGFRVFAMPVCHDVPCVGFIIEHEDMGRMLFVTDTMMLEYRVPGLNHILLEANYAEDILDAKIEAGSVPLSMKPRLIHSHMEIETTKGILRANDLSGVNEIVLIHLSNGNSDERRFVREVQETSGKPVYAAVAGLELNLSINPY